jgi:two-component system OmpR family sensor kinase
MSGVRSVGAKLSLALALVVAGALALVYVVVVPLLEDNLINAKLSQLERAAPNVAVQLPVNQFDYPDFLDTASGSANARIVVFAVLGRQPPALSVFDHSFGVEAEEVRDDPVATKVVETQAPARGVVTVGGLRYAEAAVPVGPDYVVLLRAPLADSLDTVRLVRKRMLVAGLLALAASLLVGYGAASLFARRVRRLERAAERIAAGEFDEPVVDSQRDELGELATAFDRMRERLAKLDHARNEFIANASHELRTPLFSLAGFLELFDDEDLDEATRREFLATMSEQVERLTRLATDLLDLSRLDAGRLRVEREPVDLAALAATLVGEFGPRAAAADHELELVGNGPVGALADAQRALQIGRVLVENAIRHTPSGTSIRVSVGTDPAGPALTVEDDAGGIPAEHAAHVFDRFYRADATTASGSGLGLAIARELAEVMGGSIELDARPTRTRFRLTLPAGEPSPFSRETLEAVAG